MNKSVFATPIVKITEMKQFALSWFISIHMFQFILIKFAINIYFGIENNEC